MDKLFGKEIIFPTRKDAEDIVSNMLDIIDNQSYCTLEDFKNLIGEEATYLDSRKGWDDLVGLTIKKVKDGHRLCLPEFSDLDDIKERLLTKHHSGKYPYGTDPVTHPIHYQSNSGLEVIDVIKAFTEDLTGMEAVDTGNVLKYVCRWKKKNGLEDLKKAKWYLENLINFEEGKEKES